MKPSYLCVDASNLIHRFYHGTPVMMSRSTGFETHALYSWIHLLFKFKDRMKFLPANIQPIIFFDGQRRTTEDLGFEYKGQRGEVNPQLKRQLKLCRRVTEMLGIAFVENPTMEADALLGSFVLSNRELAHSIFILSSDKDMLQLVGGNVWAIKQNNGDYTLVDSNAVVARWGVTPQQIPDLLIMMGDQSDNIPGLPGIGVKTAVKLLSEHQSIDRILEVYKEWKPGKLQKCFADNLDQIPGLRKLVQFEVIDHQVEHPVAELPLLKQVLRELDMTKTLSLFA